ncbi:MAG: DNA helicase PcrA [Geodermatophilaceae bacterium]|nr:DNA helicase PcrA [Geodermatophilaceae bacterium]MDQ3464267.1 DNA helicase PcrA [Actinomycetota bacterium]
MTSQYAAAALDPPIDLADPLLAALNPQQQQAVLHEGGPLLIVAGAGSGKTRVLAHRIAWLLKHRRVQPGEIVAITFTNKAAGEMRERVTSLIGPRARAMWVSTFHSMCVRILRAHAKELGFTSSFTIYDKSDSQRLMTLVVRDLDLDPKRYPARSLVNQISNLKNELIHEESYSPSNAVDKVLAEAYRRYQRRLREANAMDFDDLIMTAVNLLQAFPEVGEHYRRRFTHVLVDEYQDTNHAQYVLVRELAGGDQVGERVGELCVVGDADQSIYAFRGATIRNIVEFERDYPDATTVLLEQNYRSTQTILRAANAVIARNPARRPKNLWSDQGAGKPIEGYVADNEHDEAAWIAGEIDRLGGPEGVRPGDVAVFYRTNNQSRVFEEIFIRVGLPYRVVGGVRFYERREVRDALAYLKTIANPADVVSLRRIINTPRRGVGQRAEACVEALAARERIPFPLALERCGEAPGINARSVGSITDFTTMMAEFRSLAVDGAGPSSLLAAVLDRTGYLAELQASTDPQDEGRVDNLNEMVSVAAEFEQQRPDGSLAEFLEQVSLVADADEIPEGSGPDDPQPGAILLMTVHTAKGLEFPVVFLTGLEDGVFPHLRSLGEEAELAEERRLAYVAITRAQRLLHVSRAVTRTAWGQPSYNAPSRFLKEIPEELVHWVRTEPSRERMYSGGQSAQARLAGAALSRGGLRGGVGNRAVVSLDVGDRVSHDAFGLGTVVATRGAGDKSEATIDFGSAGTKRLLLRYAPVEKL